MDTTTTTAVRVEIGLATYRALDAIYAVAADLLVGEEDASEVALLEGRLALLGALTPGKWKARGSFVVSQEIAEMVAEDLRSWAEGGPVAEWDGLAMNANSENMVRGALSAIAERIEATL
jgi:hypothetical protein